MNQRACCYAKGSESAVSCVQLRIGGHIISPAAYRVSGARRRAPETLLSRRAAARVIQLLSRARIAGVLGGAGIRCGAGICCGAGISCGTRIFGRARTICGARIGTGLFGGTGIAGRRARAAAGRHPCCGGRAVNGLPGSDRIGQPVMCSQTGVPVRYACRGKPAGADRESQDSCAGDQGILHRCHHFLRLPGA